MADTLITKRLLISGLTPAITKDDITSLLGSFGSVKSADGFGLLDALGQPRKFAFVTLETTPSKLGKCMNVLSGSVWRGTKLRLGEARPDYRERIARENQRAAEEPPKKRRRRYEAVHAEDMSLVTQDNVTERSGWKVSPLGRITHPIIMRPAHPLPPVQATHHRIDATNSSKSASKEKQRKRKHESVARPTRTVIDMAEWGSTHLKGIFLDSDVVLPGKSTLDVDDLRESDVGDSDSSEDSDIHDSLRTHPPAPLQNVPKKCASPPTSPQQALSFTEANEKSPVLPDALEQPRPESQSMDVQHEKAQVLDLLASLFGGKNRDDDDWFGNESAGSDIDTGELLKGDQMLEFEDVGYEEVPIGQGKDGTPLTIFPTNSNRAEQDNNTSPSNDSNLASSTTKHVVPKPTTSMTNKTTLKDLFGPKEDAGFSLLDHLDLDIEMNDDLPLLAEQTQTVQPVMPEEAISVSHPVPKTGRQQVQPRIVLDSQKTLFFPLAASHALGANKARQRDIYDLARDNGWSWRNPAFGFWNKESEEESTKKWEESRGELTKQWKKRWREAGKARNRKKCDGDDV